MDTYAKCYAKKYICIIFAYEKNIENTHSSSYKGNVIYLLL